MIRHSGTTAEITGGKDLKRDIGRRLFVYRGNLKQELNWYHPHDASIIEAFVAGVNAYKRSSTGGQTGASCAVDRGTRR